MEKVSPHNGGCWFCHRDRGYLVFDQEFDTRVHHKCIAGALNSLPKNEEAEIMEYLLEGTGYDNKDKVPNALQTTREFTEAYSGIQPQTGPVNNMTKRLFGYTETNFEHTLRCNRISGEIGASPTFINTALYSMGK